jgi:hypothetical protein
MVIQSRSDCKQVTSIATALSAEIILAEIMSHGMESHGMEIRPNDGPPRDYAGADIPLVC